MKNWADEEEELIQGGQGRSRKELAESAELIAAVITLAAVAILLACLCGCASIQRLGGCV